jgi:hypothetical protein
LKPSLRCETDYFATEKMREELKLQEWVDRIHDESYLSEIKLNFNELFFFFSSFKSGLQRNKPYPRMLVSEEPYVEPTKLERLSLRESNKQQWVADKVLFYLLV